MSRALERGVTAGGMTRVAAVIASMAESALALPAPTEHSHVPLNDLIAKAAQVVEAHASTAQRMRRRGLAQQGRAHQSSLAATTGHGAMALNKLDVVR